MGRVIVIGNAGLDLRLAVPHLPRAGETLVGAGDAQAPGGKGLNQAVVAARCGAEVRFCAALGNDPQADEVERHLVSEGFAQLLLHRLSHPTDFSLLMVLPDGENSIVTSGACAVHFTFDQARAALDDVTAGDIVLLQGNLSPKSTASLLAAARQRSATTIFNPAPFWPPTEALLDDCSVVTANRVEADGLGPALDRLPTAIITLGGDGCVLIYQGQRRPFAAPEVDTVDTTGCGDVFCGVIAAALARAWPIERAIDAAQKAAAITASRPGAFAALPSRAELKELFR